MTSEPLRVEHYPYLNRTTETVHLASQYLAMAGKYFASSQSDDSHTNMSWNAAEQRLEGNVIQTDPDGRFALVVPSLTLQLLQGGKVVASCPLAGRRQEEGITWMRMQLQELGLAAEQYQISYHYDLPDYALGDHLSFGTVDTGSLELFARIRSWGHQICGKYREPFAFASPARTWPRHFDHGVYAPLAHNEKGEPSRSISFGLAIHDGLIPEHYWYITHWSADEITYPTEMPALSLGSWDIPRLHGASLPLSQLIHLSLAEREDGLHRFFDEVIAASQQFIGTS